MFRGLWFGAGPERRQGSVAERSASPCDGTQESLPASSPSRAETTAVSSDAESGGADKGLNESDFSVEGRS